MNLLQRVIRLPFVASSSAFQLLINTGLLALGLLGVVKKNPQLHALPAHQPVVRSNPLKVLKHFIDNDLLNDKYNIIMYYENILINH